nr:response regulator [uncultured Sulfurimonas sp.]
MSKEKLLSLREKADDLTLLYVEDNKKLQEQASKIFKKIFKNLILANSGESAYLLYKEHQPEIIITDINMHNLNGLELSKMIKKIDPFAKIIITTAFDDKGYLLEAIDLNISKYLKKPLAAIDLIEAITKVVSQLEFEKSTNILEHYKNDVFQYQDSLLMLIQNNEILIANKKSLEFFSQENIEDFKEFFKEFDKQILKHNNFLYNHDDIEWLSTIKENTGKLFNVKMADANDNSRHFVLKAYKIPDKDDTYILSFDDITDLNLLVIYDKEAMKNEKQESQKKIIYGVLEVIKRNNSTIKAYNSYKGLNISNVGVLEDISEKEIIIQLPFAQLKAVKVNNNITLESDLFPTAVFCNIKKIDLDNSQVIINKYKFIDSMPSQQEHLRVSPEHDHKISLFYDERKIHANLKIIDISVSGAKIALSLIPAGFQIGDEVVVDIVFKLGTKPLIINTKAKVDKLIEEKREFIIILIFDNDLKVKKLITEYVANRQMALIREFKNLSI